jgi:hypothetical protein
LRDLFDAPQRLGAPAKIGGILRNEIEHIFKAPQSIAQ